MTWKGRKVFPQTKNKTSLFHDTSPNATSSIETFFPLVPLPLHCRVSKKKKNPIIGTKEPRGSTHRDVEIVEVGDAVHVTEVSQVGGDAVLVRGNVCKKNKREKEERFVSKKLTR